MTPNDDGRALSTVKVFRVPQSAGSGLILEANGKSYDLSRGLGHARRGDLLDLATRGFFDQTENIARVCSSWPVQAPTEVLTPFEPRHVGKILVLAKPVRELVEHAAAEGGGRWFENRSPASLVASGAGITTHERAGASGDGSDGVLLQEVFLAVVIARRLRACDEAAAEAAVAGFTVASDFKRRSLDGRTRRPWFGEAPGGALGIGPAFVPRASFDLSSVAIRARRSRGDVQEPQHTRHTGELALEVPLAVAALSRVAILHPGDLVLIPTGIRVGAVDCGDLVRCSIDGIGELSTHVLERTRMRRQA